MDRTFSGGMAGLGNLVVSRSAFLAVAWNAHWPALLVILFLTWGTNSGASGLSAPGPVLVSDMDGSTSKTLSDNNQFI